MLGIKKVKVHGFADKRWTTQDKITQFKGITNLYCKFFYTCMKVPFKKKIPGIINLQEM